MCGMNLAFNCELIGPAMYFELMGDGQRIGRYDDIWGGWCIKVVSFSFTKRFITQICQYNHLIFSANLPHLVNVIP